MANKKDNTKKKILVFFGKGSEGDGEPGLSHVDGWINC